MDNGVLQKHSYFPFFNSEDIKKLCTKCPGCTRAAFKKAIQALTVNMMNKSCRLHCLYFVVYIIKT